ncbi:hypothetical protein AAKU52_001305 [Pedobacter sp. CG_S7]|uniref:SusE domain-containing protein n=1 Tax=Pedobacter sp. CG_S7 TaxID=3143930 RepID=UPI0033908A46
MKKHILRASLYLLVFLGFTGCKKDNEFKQVSVTAVNTLYAPDDGKNMLLQNSSTASLYFEWEKSVAQDNGLVYYDVLFDKVDGDFSEPVYVVPADNNGISTSASITHKVLNRIGTLAGYKALQEGVLKWTVVASRGLNKAKSEQVRKINITLLGGVESPALLYITGEGTESGADLSKALPFKALAGGNEFEIYTKLTAGKNYMFVDSKTTVSRTFSVDEGGTTFKESKTGTTVKKDGIYRIHLDFTASAVVISEVTKLDFFMSTPEQRETLIYQGAGIWKSRDFVPDFTTKFGDDRYFFWMTLNGKEQKLGSTAKDNQPPPAKTGPYFSLKFYPEDKNQWDYSFKFPNRNLKKCSIIVSFSGDGANNTHEIVY